MPCVLFYVISGVAIRPRRLVFSTLSQGRHVCGNWRRRSCRGDDGDELGEGSWAAVSRVTLRCILHSIRQINGTPCLAHKGLIEILRAWSGSDVTNATYIITGARLCWHALRQYQPAAVLHPSSVQMDGT